VLEALPDAALADALSASPLDLDVHAIALDPSHFHAPNGDALRRVISHYGGAYTEIAVDELARLDTGLEPSWLGLTTPGLAFPDELRAGDGVVVTEVARHPGRVVLAAHQDTAVTVAARPAAAASIAHLVGRAPAVDADHALVVLSTVGRLAKARRALIVGGGPFTRMISGNQPTFPPEISVGNAAGIAGSSLDRTIIQRMVNDQLEPNAYFCYQRALPRAPALAGTATITLEIARGEVVRASVAGLGDAAFDGCLVDAAYGVTPPLPSPGINVDDRVVVHCPLTFTMRDDHPYVAPGDADSSTPLDIDAIQGGVPRHVRIDAVDANTPLGKLRP
jgi:hypothetical protein